MSDCLNDQVVKIEEGEHLVDFKVRRACEQLRHRENGRHIGTR